MVLTCLTGEGEADTPRSAGASESDGRGGTVDNGRRCEARAGVRASAPKTRIVVVSVSKQRRRHALTHSLIHSFTHSPTVAPLAVLCHYPPHRPPPPKLVGQFASSKDAHIRSPLSLQQKKYPKPNKIIIREHLQKETPVHHSKTEQEDRSKRKKISDKSGIRTHARRQRFVISGIPERCALTTRPSCLALHVEIFVTYMIPLNLRAEIWVFSSSKGCI